MSALTIEDIDADAITIRLVNTAKTYLVPLDRVIRLQCLQGLPRDEILLAGVVAGKVARRRPALLAQYDFSDVAVCGDFRPQHVVFDRSVGFVAGGETRVDLPFRELLGNLDAISRLSDEAAFYLGFSYALFALPGEELSFGDHPRPYLKLK
ncbi:hypothetical protein [Chromobacterium violaceum]|uniref:Uncharacterized protein n=2 Tax=Chromobacterium violaceum TaxID=536 RepID=A0A1R0MR09_CHRVL|nr:hypothetical protein [Chromobacterium violaceum]AAQ58243.1 hypothetical protein CV_0567 [Chromobacterium violaceum ATCC 12472]ATP27387.1 hypothetical protein CRN81_02665 [Chromobacterium violaceum]ATP31304.1 hypothetical protein CR207_02685 [Chromobacterium violaceum]KMN50843.1 hypothetical protein VK93_05600 [Chromobacterium violaceum]KMN85266.1 hypothetical protein VL02_15465 [Chromobacterium violaceum]